MPPTLTVPLPAPESDVAKIFGFSFFGFFVSLLDLVLLPLAMVCPLIVQVRLAGVGFNSQKKASAASCDFRKTAVGFDQVITLR